MAQTRFFYGQLETDLELSLLLTTTVFRYRLLRKTHLAIQRILVILALGSIEGSAFVRLQWGMTEGGIERHTPPSS